MTSDLHVGSALTRPVLSVWGFMRGLKPQFDLSCQFHHGRLPVTCHWCLCSGLAGQRWNSVRVLCGLSDHWISNRCSVWHVRQAAHWPESPSVHWRPFPPNKVWEHQQCGKLHFRAACRDSVKAVWLKPCTENEPFSSAPALIPSGFCIILLWFNPGL